MGCAVDSLGYVYVRTFRYTTVLKYSPSGTIVDTFYPPSYPEHSGDTAGIWVDPENNVWSGDVWGVHKFSPSGALLLTCGYPTDCTGIYPFYAFALSGNSCNLYMGDVLDEYRVIRLAFNGSRISSWNVGYPPYAIGVGPAGRVYVAGDDNGVVEIYEETGADLSDADGDDIPDCWEGADSGVPFATAAGERLYNLPGSHPTHKDLYVEIDALRNCEPSQAALDSVVAAFRRAPVENPDSTLGIDLHIPGDGCDPCVDDRDIGSGNTIWAIDNFSNDCDAFSYFGPIWEENFGTSDERGGADPSATLAAKAKVFRYGLFADLAVNTFSLAKYNGRSWWIPGNLFWVALGDQESNSWQREAGVLMHELGHCLGLTHGGRADYPYDVSIESNFKPNYYSVMNYTWITPVGDGLLDWPSPLDLALWRSSWRLDYSRSPLNLLTECALDETAGIGGDLMKYVPVGLSNVGFPCVGVPPRSHPALVSMGTELDWDGDGHYGLARGNVNDIGDDTDQEMSYLTGAEDWHKLEYRPVLTPGWRLPPLPCGSGQVLGALQSTVSGGGASDSTFTHAMLAALDTLGFDCNRNGVIDRVEVSGNPAVDTNLNGIPDECELALATSVNDDLAARPFLSIRNPARTRSVEIQFGLPATSSITLDVFSVAGRKVRGLASETLTAGHHSRTWDTRDEAGLQVAAGIYFIVLRTGGEVRTQKLVVVK